MAPTLSEAGAESLDAEPSVPLWALLSEEDGRRPWVRADEEEAKREDEEASPPSMSPNRLFDEGDGEAALRKRWWGDRSLLTALGSMLKKWLTPASSDRDSEAGRGARGLLEPAAAGVKGGAAAGAPADDDKDGPGVGRSVTSPNDGRSVTSPNENGCCCCGCSWV